MKKILLICILLLAIIVSFAACDGKDTPPNSDENVTPPSSEENDNESPIHTHEFGNWELTLKPTCTESGAKVRYCSCGETQNGFVVSLGHSPEEAIIEDMVEATYETDGRYKEVVRCSTCGEKISEILHIIPMFKHTPAEAVTENVIESTCYSEGSYDTVLYCVDCNAELERTKHTVEKVAHTPAEAVEENRVETSCSTNGSYDEVVYCSVEYCKEQISRTTVIVDALAHAEVIDAAVEPTCTQPGLTEGKHCSVCNEVIIPQTIVNKNGHTLDAFGVCTTCDELVGATQGVIYRLSATQTYAEVVGYTGEASRVKIADSYEGVPVKTIFDKAFYQSTITSVIIPDTVTKIGSSAFDSCKSLTSIIIPNSVTLIGSSAFKLCDNLKSVELSENLTIIGNNTFSYCDSLTSITIPNSVTSIDSYAFYSCDALASVKIGEGVTSIGFQAFKSCYALTYLIIPDNVVSISDDAFWDCNGLTYVVIGDGLTEIGSEVFYSCTSLLSVVIGKNVTKINDYAFKKCSSLTSLTISNNLISIGYQSFYECNNISDIYYTGTKEEWKNIYIGNYNTYLSVATMHYNYVPEE